MSEWAEAQAQAVRRVLDAAGKARPDEHDAAHEAVTALVDEVDDWEAAWVVLAAHPEMPKPIRAMMRRRLERTAKERRPRAQARPAWNEATGEGVELYDPRTPPSERVVVDEVDRELLS